MNKIIFRKILSIVIILNLSIALFSCGSKPASEGESSPEAEENVPSVESIFEDSIARTDTPEVNTLHSPNTKYSDKVLSNSGITFHLPKEYVNTDGYIEFSDYDISGGEGVNYASGSYVGMPESEYRSYVNNENLSTEDMQYLKNHIYPIFIILSINDDRDLSDLLGILNENLSPDSALSEDNFEKLTTVDGCSFYEFMSEFDYDGNLEDNYEDEYLTLIEKRDELIGNATFTAPESVYAESSEPEKPTSSKDAYRIFVVDESGDPVSGVTVQFRSDEITKMAVTGENGMISFDDPEDVYEVYILNAPDEYSQYSTIYHTKENYSDMIITLKKSSD